MEMTIMRTHLVKPCWESSHDAFLTHIVITGM